MKKKKGGKVLGEAMLRLAQDVDLCKEMGEAGRKYIAENFSYKVIADKFYKFFSKI